MKNKNAALIVIALVILVVAFSFFYRPTEPVIPGPTGEQNASTTAWSTYHDEKYHFSIDYPANLFVFTEDDKVVFTDGEGGMGMSGVHIEPTSFHTPEEEVVAMNKKITDSYAGTSQDPNLIPIILIDEHITVEGFRAITTHSKNSQGPDRPIPNTMLFIKDGKLFTIFDRSLGFEQTWQSFHFEE